MSLSQHQLWTPVGRTVADTETETELLSLRAEIQQLKINEKTHEEERKRAENVLATKESIIQSLVDSKKIQGAELDRLQRAEKDYRQTSSDQESKLGRERNTEAIHGHNTTYNQTLTALQKENDHLKAQLAHHSSEQNSITKGAISSYLSDTDDRVASVERAKETLEKRVQALNNTISDLQSAAETLRQREKRSVDSLNQKLTNLESEKTALKTTKDTVESTLAEVEEQLEKEKERREKGTRSLLKWMVTAAYLREVVPTLRLLSMHIFAAWCNTADVDFEDQQALMDAKGQDQFVDVAKAQTERLVTVTKTAFYVIPQYSKLVGEHAEDAKYCKMRASKWEKTAYRSFERYDLDIGTAKARIAKLESILDKIRGQAAETIRACGKLHQDIENLRPTLTGSAQIAAFNSLVNMFKEYQQFSVDGTFS